MSVTSFKAVFTVATPAYSLIMVLVAIDIRKKTPIHIEETVMITPNKIPNSVYLFLYLKIFLNELIIVNKTITSYIDVNKLYNNRLRK